MWVEVSPLPKGGLGGFSGLGDKLVEELLEEAIISAVRNLSPSSFINLWGITILAALSTCSVLKILIIAGYLSVLRLSNWKRLFSNVFMYGLGMGFSYLLIDILIAQTPSWISLLVSGANLLYLLTGIFLIVFGILALGILKIPTYRIKVLSREEPEHDYLSAFLLGAVIVGMEALSCPTCNPTLKLIAIIYSRQGPLFATLIFGTFFLGQSTLALLAGLILGPLKQELAKAENIEYVQIAGAIILVLVGLDLLWLS
jgi:hypothetical protein